MSRLDVCVVGELNPDLILYGLPGELQPERELLVDGCRLTLGSSSAIFAHNLSVLGTRVGFISKIGVDPFGRISLEKLTEGGVDATRVSVSPDTPTGLTVILAYTGYRFILTYPGTMFELKYEDLPLDYILSARHLHISSFFLHRALRSRIGELFRLAKSKGLSTSLDTNDDPDDKWGKDLIDILQFVDVFFPNEREAKKIAQTDDLTRAIEKLSQLSRIVAVKLGPNGALVRQGSKEWRCKPASVTPVDTVGAGDSFDAGFIHRFLEGASLEDCLRYANAVGAFSTTCEGGTEAFRDPAKMNHFLREQTGAS